jgi:predicted regulator of Ras-like GTPase activity (Roadblock/LC7/MglB family)
MSIDALLKEAMTLEGAIGAAVVDYGSGMTLGEISASKDLDLTVAAAGNTEVMRAKMRTMEMLKMTDTIEDILITLGRQYHLIRPLTSRTGSGLFVYLALERSRANLALARHQLRALADNVEL